MRKQPAHVLSVAMLIAGSALTSCASSSISQGPAQVDDLVSWIERVYVESELARERANAAVTQLEAILAAEYEDDAVQAYTRFVEALRRSEAQAERLTQQVEPMREAAQPVFDNWAASIEKFQSETMRKRSQSRLEATRQRYESILFAIEPTQTTYAKLNASLRDHALFLGNDFNPTAVEAIEEDARALITLARQLDTGFEKCLSVTRAYVEAAALPVQAAPAPGGPGARFRRR